jgi:hypothetical protein
VPYSYLGIYPTNASEEPSAIMSPQAILSPILATADPSKKKVLDPLEITLIAGV